MKNIKEKRIQLVMVGGGWLPANPEAEELLQKSVKGEIITVVEVFKRDRKLHRCYMSLLGFIYDYLPLSFRSKIPKNKFYVFLKELKGEYTILKVGKLEIKEYHSTSFGRMTQEAFKTYVTNQIPFIYKEVIQKIFEEPIANNIIETIEDEYKTFLSKFN